MIDDLPEGGCIGIDPGADGCISYIWDVGEAAFWRFKEMTDQEVWDVFLGLSGKARSGALEKVGAMPKQGLSTTFAFGRNAGKVEAWLVAARVRWDWVTPAKWQTDLRCRSGGDKKVTQAAAQKLWPHLKIAQPAADGLLIGEWCRTKAPWAQ